MKEIYKISDNSGDKKYFTIVPNYIANHSTANDQALYFQLKRFAGENGICYATRKTLMENLGIGKQALNKSFDYLISKGWITYIGETSGKTHPIKTYKINDIWKINNDHYEKFGARTAITSNSLGLEQPLQRGSNSHYKGAQTAIEEERNIKEENIKEEYAFNIEKIYQSYKEKINSGSRLTGKGKNKILTRLKEYSAEELLKAIDCFSKNAWYMKNCGWRGIPWFFNSEDRIEQFLNIKEERKNKTAVIS